jgi:MarR family 2-MHQ and catechol resistance regulon transcriptional repressor
MATLAKDRHTHDSALEHDARALQSALGDLLRVYQFRDRDRICCHDISVTQCHALDALVDHAPLRLGELADRLYLDKSTTSRVISALVRKGYVRQTSESGDRRAVVLTPTAAGRRLYATITDDLVDQQKELMGSSSPEVRRAVIDVVRKLATAAEARFGVGVSEQPNDCCSRVE